MLIYSRELRTGLPGSCSDARSLKTWVLWVPPWTCETLWSWFPITERSIKEATRTAVVFFTKGLSSTVAKALGPFLILHLALFLGVAYSWVPVPFDVMALGFWSWTPLPLGTSLWRTDSKFQNSEEYLIFPLSRRNCVWSQQVSVRLYGSNLQNTI